MRCLVCRNTQLHSGLSNRDSCKYLDEYCVVLIIHQQIPVDFVICCVCFIPRVQTTQDDRFPDRCCEMALFTLQTHIVQRHKWLLIQKASDRYRTAVRSGVIEPARIDIVSENFLVSSLLFMYQHPFLPRPQKKDWSQS